MIYKTTSLAFRRMEFDLILYWHLAQVEAVLSIKISSGVKLKKIYTPVWTMHLIQFLSCVILIVVSLRTPYNYFHLINSPAFIMTTMAFPSQRPPLQSVGPRGEITPSTIQKMLDENHQLIMTIVDYQSKGMFLY